MTDLILILPCDPLSEAMLARRDGPALSVQRGPIDALGAQLTSAYTIILPGQQVRAFLTDVPESVRGAERINVARYAHEERLATDPGDLHIVVGRGDPAPTLMVSKTLLQDHLSRFDPVQIMADFDALSELGSDPVKLLDRIVTPGPSGDAVDLDWHDGRASIYDDATLAQAVFARLDQGDALNLRTGPYRRRTSFQSGPWMRVAAVALFCGVLFGALSWAESRALSAQADALRASARAAYTQATGQAPPANLARAIRVAAPTGQNPAAFLDLSNQLFAAMRDHPDIAVERLSFDAQENVLRLRLIYPGFEAAGALEQTVSNQGSVFVTGGVREQNGRFIGDATFSAGGDA